MCFFVTRRVSKVIFIERVKPAPDHISIKLLKVNNLLDSTTTAIMFSAKMTLIQARALFNIEKILVLVVILVLESGALY